MTPPGPPRLLPRARWTTTELGLPAHATVRCLQPLPTGDLAVGTDYDMLLWRAGRFLPFPFPQGARRESRSVDSMAVVDGVLHVATQRSRFTWPLRGPAQGRGHPQDGLGGFDDLRAVYAAPWGLLEGWRTHLAGAEGPGECMSFATDPEGRVYAGTLTGQLWLLNGGLVRSFEAQGRPRPVRYLAWAHGALWAAAAGALHRWDGGAWTSHGAEPYALHTDATGVLWALAEGGVWASRAGEWPQRVALNELRPWTLASTAEDLWVGAKGALVQAARLL